MEIEYVSDGCHDIGPSKQNFSNMNLNGHFHDSINLLKTEIDRVHLIG